MFSIALAALTAISTLMAGPTGLWITTETGSRKIPSIKQMPIASAHAPGRLPPMRAPIRVGDHDAVGRTIRPGTASPSFRIGP
jgi:hypothetical protein